MGLSEIRMSRKGQQGLYHEKVLLHSDQDHINHVMITLNSVRVWVSNYVACALHGFNPANEQIMMVRLQGATFTRHIFRSTLPLIKLWSDQDDLCG